PQSRVETTNNFQRPHTRQPARPQQRIYESDNTCAFLLVNVWPTAAPVSRRAAVRRLFYPTRNRRKAAAISRIGTVTQFSPIASGRLPRPLPLQFTELFVGKGPSMKASDLLVRCLEEEQIEYVFGV